MVGKTRQLSVRVPDRIKRWKEIKVAYWAVFFAHFFPLLWHLMDSPAPSQSSLATETTPLRTARSAVAPDAPRKPRATSRRLIVFCESGSMPSPPRTPSRAAKRAMAADEASRGKETTKEQLCRLKASRVALLEGAAKFMEFAKLLRTVGECPEEATAEQQRRRDEAFLSAVELADKEFEANIEIVKGDLSGE